MVLHLSFDISYCEGEFMSRLETFKEISIGGIQRIN